VAGPLAFRSPATGGFGLTHPARPFTVSAPGAFGTVNWNALLAFSPDPTRPTMQPTVFGRIEAHPFAAGTLTANGKVNVKATPETAVPLFVNVPWTTPDLPTVSELGSTDTVNVGGFPAAAAAPAPTESSPATVNSANTTLEPVRSNLFMVFLPSPQFERLVLTRPLDRAIVLDAHVLVNRDLFSVEQRGSRAAGYPRNRPADVVGSAWMAGLREKLGDATRSLRDVFRNPGLRRIELAFAGSIVGDWAYGVAGAVYIYEQGGPTAVGILGVVRYISMALVTPFAAMLGDRYPRRLVMVGSDSIRGLLVLTSALLIADGANHYAVYTIVVLTSIAATPFRSAQASYLPDLATGPADLAAANVASSTIESVGFFAGPALAGILLAVSNISTVFIFNAATFVWSAFLVLGIKPPPKPAEAEGAGADEAGEAAAPEPAEDAKPGFLAEASAGYREILGNRDLRLLIGLYCAQTVVAGASLVFEVSVALGLLGLNRSGLGYLNATLGIGGLAGGFVALVLAQRSHLARDFGIGVFFWSAPLLLLAAWPSVTAAVIVWVLIGLANSVVDVNAFTILQRIASKETMARVFGAMESAVIGTMALGALAMPLLISTIGIRWGLVVIGAGVGAPVLLGLRGLQRIDRVALAPAGLGLLRGVSLLSLLPEPTLESLARALVRVEAAPGEVFIREGDPGDLFYVIETGTVDVTKEGRHVASLGPGDFVGEIALLRDVPRVATVTATSATVLQALDRANFIPAVTGQGAFGEAAETTIASRLAML